LEFLSDFDIRISYFPGSLSFARLRRQEFNSRTKHNPVRKNEREGPMHVRFVYMTAGNLEEAQEIGRELVSAGLAACVNILPRMNSIYVWEGRLEEASEVVMIAKTVETRVVDLIARVKSLHSYSCPCIVSLKVEDGYPPFLEWVAENVKI
jgi:periplasmic divalent cation tolerance protein